MSYDFSIESKFLGVYEQKKKEYDEYQEDEKQETNISPYEQRVVNIDQFRKFSGNYSDEGDAVKPNSRYQPRKVNFEDEPTTPIKRSPVSNFD